MYTCINKRCLDCVSQSAWLSTCDIPLPLVQHSKMLRSERLNPEQGLTVQFVSEEPCRIVPRGKGLQEQSPVFRAAKRQIGVGSLSQVLEVLQCTLSSWRVTHNSYRPEVLSQKVHISLPVDSQPGEIGHTDLH